MSKNYEALARKVIIAVAMIYFLRELDSELEKLKRKKRKVKKKVNMLKRGKL